MKNYFPNLTMSPLKKFFIFLFLLTSCGPSQAPLVLVAGQSNAERLFQSHILDDYGDIEEAAIGGTKISCWQIDNSCFKAYVETKVNEPFSAIIWWQGESDSTDPSSYKEDLKNLITSWRTFFNNPRLPFIIIGLEKLDPVFDGFSSEENFSEIRAQQEEVSKDLNDICFVPIFDITDGHIHPEISSEIIQRIENCLP